MVMLVSVVDFWWTIGSLSAGAAISASRTAIEAAYFITLPSLQIGWRDHTRPRRCQVGRPQLRAIGRGLCRAGIGELRRVGREVGEFRLHPLAHGIKHGPPEP